MKRTIEDSMSVLKYILAILFLFTLFSMILTLRDIRDTGNDVNRLSKENNVYHRTVACVLSVPLATRTEDYISNCYLKAEQQNGIKVDHFGNR